MADVIYVAMYTIRECACVYAHTKRPATSHKSCGQLYKSLQILNLEIYRLHKLIVKFCILELT